MDQNNTIDQMMADAVAKRLMDRTIGFEPKVHSNIFITLGHDNEFGISDDNLFIRKTTKAYYEDPITIDLGPATVENFGRLINNMTRLRNHMIIRQDNT